MLVAGAASSQAALIAYDGFDGNEFGFSASFDEDGSFAADPTGLSYPDLMTGTGGATISSGSLDGILSSSQSSGDVWVSYLVEVRGGLINPDFGGWSRMNTYDGAFGGSTEQFNFGVMGDDIQLRYVGDNVESTGVTWSQDTTYFIVAQFDMPNETATLWVNPDAATSSPQNFLGSYSFTGVPSADMAFDRLRLTAEHSPLVYDEVRVGDTFFDVAVPEPSTYAASFGALALLAAFFRRFTARKRSSTSD